MDIGIDISPLQNGHRMRGIGSYAYGLLYGLAQLRTGDRYILYYWKGLPLDVDRSMLPQDVTWVGVPFPRLGRLSALVAQQLLMLPYVLARRPDVYHQLGVVADPAAGGLPWFFLSRCVVTVHDLTPLRYRDAFFGGKRLRELVYRLMLAGVRRARQVIADSRATEDDLVQLLGVGRDRITVAPLAVSPRLSAALDSPGKTPPGLPPSYILTVAGDYPNKNLATLLAAYERIACYPEVPDLVLVGPPGPSVARFQKSNPGAAARLHLYSQLSDAELAGAYRNATVVVVPSEYEGFGLPVLEAMAVGAPVIAADSASLPEVAGDAALLVPPKDASALAEAVRSLCGQSEARAALRSRGFERVRCFSWEHTARATYAAYCRAVEGCEASGARLVGTSHE